MIAPFPLRSVEALRIVALAGLSVLVGWLVAPVDGWAIAAIGALVMLLLELVALHRLRWWLRHPSAESIPNSHGAWQEVFATIYRQYAAERQLQARLSSSLDRMVRASEALPDGVIVLDSANRIDWCNRAASHQFNISVPRDRGQPVTNLIRYGELVDYVNDIAGRPGPVQLRTNHASPMVLSVQLLPFGESEKLMLARDVTLLERTETIRRDFVANVSHELRTPLTVVNGFLEHLTEAPADSASAQRQLRLMREQTERMMRLVTDLLTLSRLEATNTPPHEEVIDMIELVGKLLEEGRSLSRERHTLSASVAGFDLRGNGFELRTAFSNLVSNAVRYTPAGGAIELAWVVDSSGARFTVTDTGIGIPADHIPRLTERFYRVDRGRSREQGGTGLGLAIVRHVLIRHDASLDVRSVPQCGSTFSCVFAHDRVAERGSNEEVSSPRSERAWPCAPDGDAPVAPRGARTALRAPGTPAL